MMGNNNQKKDNTIQILTINGILFICSIVAIVNTNKDDAKLIGIEHMYEYILALLIVTASIFGIFQTTTTV